MNSQIPFVVLNLHPKEGGHDIFECDVEVRLVLANEVITEIIVCSGMNHVIHKQTVHNPLMPFMLHEYYLLTIDSEVSMLFHAGRDQHWHVPLASGLPSTIHALHQLQSIPVLHMLGPPIRWTHEVDLPLANFPIEERLLSPASCQT